MVQSVLVYRLSFLRRLLVPLIGAAFLLIIMSGCDRGKQVDQAPATSNLEAESSGPAANVRGPKPPMELIEKETPVPAVTPETSATEERTSATPGPAPVQTPGTATTTTASDPGTSSSVTNMGVASSAPVYAASGKPEATSLSPAKVRQDVETSLTISGRNLAGAVVEYRRNKEETTPAGIIENTGDKLVIMRTPNDAPLVGQWDIAVKLPDGSESVLPAALEILEPGDGSAPEATAPPQSPE